MQQITVQRSLKTMQLKQLPRNSGLSSDNRRIENFVLIFHKNNILKKIGYRKGPYVCKNKGMVESNSRLYFIPPNSSDCF